MAKFQIAEGVPTGTAHPDYERNLKAATNFITKMTPKLPNGMNVSIRDSEKLIKSIVLFVFSPHPEQKCGRYSHPVCLHENFYEVRGKVGRAWYTFVEISNNNKRFTSHDFSFDSIDSHSQNAARTIPSVPVLRLTQQQELEQTT